MSETLADLIEARFGFESEVGRGWPAEGALASILAHRTHRRYADKPVDDETLELLLACAFSTPSKSDLQQASVIVVRDGARRRALAELIPDMPWIATAPVFLVFCGDGRRTPRISALRDKPFANDHLDAFLNAAADAAMHLATFITAADAAGLGTCPISVLRNHVAAVAEILELPERVFPLAGCCLGWPAREGFVSLRLPLALTVHQDTYDDGKLGGMVDDYDQRRDARYSIPADQHKYPADYGEAEFYGWSEDKARQVSKPERADLGHFLRRHGFCLD